MFDNHNYACFSASEYYDAVIRSPEQVSEAVYYLLRHRLRRALGRVYQLYGFGLDDHFEDTIDDFFLYLYDWGAEPPFAIFGTVREKQAFFGWTVGTYRNFLLNLGKETLKRKEAIEKAVVLARGEDPVAKETLMGLMATAIAFADQELKPRSKFIFYRMLLTLLDPRSALPQEVMAQAMGMHPVTYRVCVNRLRARLLNDVNALKKGEGLPLDPEHWQMRNHLFQGFDRLYETLIPSYEACLQTLSQAVAIDTLRKDYGSGNFMHEGLEYEYPHVVDVWDLYERLKS